MSELSVPDRTALCELDPDTLDRLSVARVAGRSPLICRLAPIFAAEVQSRLGAAADALGAGDFHAASECAHALKGMASQIGASCFARAAADLEQHARREQARRAAELLFALREAAEHISAELQARSVALQT